MLKNTFLSFKKIYVAWLRLESYGRNAVEKELKDFADICRGSVKMAIAMPENYSFMYNRIDERNNIDLPILSEFLKEVEKISKEAYNFLTEGYDIINFKEYIKLKGKSTNDVVAITYNLKSYSTFIQYAFMKLFDEKDEKKKKIMLKGLLGI